MAKRRIHIGIDYGTSTSKIVVRDYGAPGGERAILVSRDGRHGFSSSVRRVGDTFMLGDIPETEEPSDSRTSLYTSIKMRVAAEVKGQHEKYFYGTPESLPEGVTAFDLAVLTVWWLISEGIRSLAKGREYSIGMTLGVPMSFFNDVQLRDTFVRIARSAWFLFRHNNVLTSNPMIKIEQLQQCLRPAYESVGQTPVLPDQVRDWIRAEAEAAMWAAFQAPEVPAGPYAKVDIGAGTTNASVFRIVDEKIGGRWVKAKLAFFGCNSVPFGMDAVDEGLARCSSIPQDEIVGIRGHEEEFLNITGARSECKEAIDGIVRAFHEAWRQGYEKNKGSSYEINAWDHCKVFTIGGGSLVSPIREAIRVHPDGNKRDKWLDLHQLSCPQDLKLAHGRLPIRMLPFVLVAYGLSVIGLSIPEAKTPEEIPPMPKTKPRLQLLDADDIYSK